MGLQPFCGRLSEESQLSDGWSHFLTGIGKTRLAELPAHILCALLLPVDIMWPAASSSCRTPTLRDRAPLELQAKISLVSLKPLCIYHNNMRGKEAIALSYCTILQNP